jgi:hypothetical protein
MGLTSDNTLREVQKLFDMFFQGNALFDRLVYLLDIKFNMPKFQSFMHHAISHRLPLDADKIQEFGSLRGDLFYRGALTEASEDYASVSAAIHAGAIFFAEVEKQCGIVIRTAIENGDLMYEDFIRDFEIHTVAPYIKQMVVLYTAALDYERENSIAKFNGDFSDFVIPEFAG